VPVCRQGGGAGLERAPVPARQRRREAGSARPSSARRSQSAKIPKIKTSNRPRIYWIRYQTLERRLGLLLVPASRLAPDTLPFSLLEGRREGVAPEAPCLQPPAEPPRGILALVPGEFAELVEEPALRGFARVAPVSAAYLFQGFVWGGSAHGFCHLPRCPW
jgi:hypothetical protein